MNLSQLGLASKKLPHVLHERIFLSWPWDLECQMNNLFPPCRPELRASLRPCQYISHEGGNLAKIGHCPFPAFFPQPTDDTGGGGEGRKEGGLLQGCQYISRPFRTTQVQRSFTRQATKRKKRSQRQKYRKWQKVALKATCYYFTA